MCRAFDWYKHNKPGTSAHRSHATYFQTKLVLVATAATENQIPENIEMFYEPTCCMIFASCTEPLPQNWPRTAAAEERKMRDIQPLAIAFLPARLRFSLEESDIKRLTFYTVIMVLYSSYTSSTAITWMPSSTFENVMATEPGTPSTGSNAPRYNAESIDWPR